MDDEKSRDESAWIVTVAGKKSPPMSGNYSTSANRGRED